MIETHEKIVSESIRKYCAARNRGPTIANTKAFWPVDVAGQEFESDVASLLKSGYWQEYEIKLTLADFKADRRKVNKHRLLSGQFREWGELDLAAAVRNWTPDHYKFKVGVYLNEPNPRSRLPVPCKPEQVPSRFWYVCHGFEPPADQVPEYAGLIRVWDNIDHVQDRAEQRAYEYAGRLFFQVVKDAPKIPHSKRLPDASIIRFLKCAYYRGYHYHFPAIWAAEDGAGNAV